MQQDIDIAEKITQYLPQYLSEESLRDLFAQLKDFPENLTSMYLASIKYPDEVLQADIIDDIPVFDLPDTSMKKSKVLVISNSCDNDIANSRLFPMSISYVPILKFDSLITKLRSLEIPSQKIDSFIENVKKQTLTNVIFLPRGTVFDEDLVAFLDRSLNINQSKFLKLAKNNKIATMSNYGFYIFLLKLSIHFTRIREKIDRDKI